MEHENMKNKIEEIIINELQHARSLFTNMHSAHEGYAVILEEVDELQEELEFFNMHKDGLWQSIKKNNLKIQFNNIKEMQRIIRKLIKEAIQVAAMLQRFQEDVLKGGCE
jgi:hypothetical protein